MATSPPISPTVATPLAHRKRRYSELTREQLHELIGEGEDDDGDEDDDETMPPAKRAAFERYEVSVVDGEGRKLEDEGLEGEGDDREFLEDLLDTAELEPYVPDEEERETALDAERISALKTQLLKVGVEQFFDEHIGNGKISPTLLGTAFGIDPAIEEQLGEDAFLRLLGHAIVKYYQKRQKLPQYNTIDDAAALLRQSSRILVITGAGISTSLGIPDFRSRGTGFYSMLLAQGISEPEEVFDIETFDADPQIFYKLAHGILPDDTRFTPTHAFIRLLQDKGKLQTNYTQNIDNIEERAGIERERLIQCHGSFATATCRKCKASVKGSEIFADIRAQRVARCKRCIDAIRADELAAKSKPKPKPNPKHPRFNPDSEDDDDSEADDDIPGPGVMKPDITFFGEKLPNDFFTRFTDHDAPTADLVLVIGSSLKVAPVCEIPNYLPHHVPHIFISREPVRHVNFDVQLLGDCDVVVWELCRRAGWALVHEMVPEGLEVVVEGVEGLEHVWLVRAKEGEGTGKEEGVNGVVGIGEKVGGEVQVEGKVANGGGFVVVD